MPKRWMFVLLALLMLGTVVPASAEIVFIDPRAEPELALDPAEAEKLIRLANPAFTQLYTPVSPDDAAVMAITFGLDDTIAGFTNVNDGSITPISERLFDFSPQTEIVWRNATTAAFVGTELFGDPLLVSIDRLSGTVMTNTLNLNGIPISLAPNGSRLLVAQISAPNIEEMSQRSLRESPFTLEVHRRMGAPKKERWGVLPDPKETFRASQVEILLSVLDINSGQYTPLFALPEGSGFMSNPSWSADGSKLALVRTTIAEIGRSGNLLSDIATQDGLGLLPPEQNPFLQGNIVDLFNFATGDLRPEALKGADSGGAFTYGDAKWSTDAQTLMVQLYRPSVLRGRTYPVYLFPDRSTFRFLNANLEPINTLDRPETEAIATSTSAWVSPDEVIFSSPVGLSFHLFYYNRVSGEFRRISVWEGTYYQFAATHQSRQVVFTFSSFQQPYELYRIGWDGSAMVGLTFANADLAALNQIRADYVSFQLSSGAVRSGFLIQPAGAAFPPQNVPIVSWQQGGPGGYFTNEYGGNTEMPFNTLPNLGTAVLMLALPGREGFGPEFYNALADDRNFGQIDIDEGAEIARQMVAMGWTSPDRLGVTGCSYGGYFTTQSIQRHPDLYAAANTQCTLLDLFHEWQFGYTPLVSYLEGRAPTTDSAEYAADSPLYNAGKIKTPLLIFAGSRDFLPAQISANLHDQVQANGVPVEYLVFSGEGHGLSLPQNQFTASQAQVNWFREHLAR